MFRALKHRNFQLFFAGQMISLTGTWMQNMALSWLVYRLTQSPALLGAVSFVSQIPILFLSPWAGMVADRHSRHRIIIGAQTAMMLQAFVLAALTLARVVTVWEIFVLALVLGVCNAFDMPGRQSFIVEMVGNEDLINAIALNSSMFNSARMVGPAVAGVLVATLGEGMCFLLNGISYLAVIAGLLLMKVPKVQKPTRNGAQLDQLVEGIRYVFRNRAIRSLLSLLSLVSLLGMPYAVLMPVFAQDVLGRGPGALGALMTAAGCGALVGALWLARRADVLGLDRVVVRACAGFGVGLVLFAASRMYALSLLWLVIGGFCVMVQMGSTNSLVQSIVDDEMRGRVMGLYATMFLGIAPFGSLFGGFIANNAGAPAAVMAGGIACVFGAVLVGLRIKDLNIDLQIATIRARREACGAIPAPPS